MKIKFTKLATNDGTIKVSLDGGQSFTDYNVADVHESGIPLEDSQDYEKIQIQAPANVLKNLNVISSVKVEGEDGGEGGGAGSTNESSFIIDTDTYGFEFPKCVTGIVLPNGMTTIGKKVFNTYPNLQTVVIPDGVTTISDYAFYDCTSLTSINIPDSVTSIGNSAFMSCSNLTSITIPDSVTTISNYAFYNCSKLTSINIPDSVTSIGNNAFAGCSSLKTINYTGTEEQWNAIIKVSYWNSGCPSDMVINYNYQG